jgi:hypothetical protein
VNAIEKLVAEQVDKVRVKRMTGNHPKGKEIKVCISSSSHTNCCLNPVVGDILGRWLWCQSIFEDQTGKDKPRYPSDTTARCMERHCEVGLRMTMTPCIID